MMMALLAFAASQADDEVVHTVPKAFDSTVLAQVHATVTRVFAGLWIVYSET